MRFTVKRKALLACIGAAAFVGIGLALASVSASYRHGPGAVTRAGGFCATGMQETLGTVGDSVTGRAESSSYKVAAGFLHALVFEDDMCWATDPPSIEILGGGGTSELVWISEEDGTYEVKLGEKVLAAGACAAGEVEFEEPLDGLHEFPVNENGAYRLILRLRTAPPRRRCA